MKVTFGWDPLKALHAKSKLERGDGTDRWPQLTAKMKELVERQFTDISRDLLAYAIERHDYRRSLRDWYHCWHRALSRPNMDIRERTLTQEAEKSLQDLECEGLVNPKIESSSVSVVNACKAVQIGVTLSFTDDKGGYALARFIWSRRWIGSYQQGDDPFQKSLSGLHYNHDWESGSWSDKDQTDHAHTVSFLTVLETMAGDGSDLEGTIASMCSAQ